MRKKIHPGILIPCSCVGLVVLCLAVLLFLVRTQSFKNTLRSYLIQSLQEDTGGRVELGSIGIDWRTLTVTVRGLVVHGTEPAGSPPLLRVESARIGLRTAPLLRGNFELRTIDADEPQVYLLVHNDGTTNLPKPSHNSNRAIADLLRLELDRFHLSQGRLVLNDQRYPFDIRGEKLAATLSYNAAQRAYQVNASSQDTLITHWLNRTLPLQVALKGQLSKDMLKVDQLSLVSSSSRLEASGNLLHFERPTANYRFHGTLSMQELTDQLKVSNVLSGLLTIEGRGQLDANKLVRTSGKLQLQKLGYQSRTLTVPPMDLSSNFASEGQALSLTDLVVQAASGRFSGSADLAADRSIRVKGNVSHGSLRELAAISHTNLPFSGIADGPLLLTTKFPVSLRELDLHTSLQIHPAQGAMPLSGKLDLAKVRGGLLQINNSHLSLPNTQVAIHGSPAGVLAGTIDSEDLNEVLPILAFFHTGSATAHIAHLLPGGSAHFTGNILNSTSSPSLNGILHLSHFEAYGKQWENLRYQGTLTAQTLDFSSFEIDGPAARASGSGHVNLQNWQVQEDSTFRAHGQFHDVDVARFHTADAPSVEGVAAGTLDLSGLIRQPNGTVHIAVQNPTYRGQRVQRAEADAAIGDRSINISHGVLVNDSGGQATFSGTYSRDQMDWQQGELNASVHSSSFPFGNRELKGTGAFDVRFLAKVAPGMLQPLRADGKLAISDLSVDEVNLGSVQANVSTQGQTLILGLQGDLRDSNFHGSARLDLSTDSPVHGELRFGRLNLATLSTLLHPAHVHTLAAQGFLIGSINFDGPLLDFSRWHSTARIDQLSITSPVSTVTMELHNQKPVVFDLAQGTATIRSFQLAGNQTALQLSGSAGFIGARAMNLTATGFLNLQFLRLFDPNLQSTGRSQLDATIKGTLNNPSVQGRLNLENASFALKDMSNGLSAVNGTMTFTNERATIENLTATSGGGALKVGGFVSYGGTGPLVYHLNGHADSVRVRYGSISVTANTDLRLTGTSTSSLLSGSVTVSRVVFNTSTDVGNVLTTFAAPIATPANQQEFLTGLHLDVTIESTPDLELATSLSRDVEASIDLRLRGTPDHPVLLGSVSANQGDIRAFGSRYTLNRGEVSFVNSNKIDPVLDLDLQTRARGITVNITISGTINRLNISYRSDPPLQPRDIIALLTVGRTPQEASNVQSTQLTSDANMLQSNASSVLGQAMTPSSGRLSKLFGVTNIKLDPLVQGITANTQSRLTLEQQVSRSITVTYVTNLEQTSEQIFRVEWAINRQYSVVAVRDDNGEFGIDFQYKKRFK
jgi:translocation and assembly module TamB